MKNKKALYLAQGGVIAALYVVLTYICSMMGLSSGVIQVRFSEALTILPLFTPAAVLGLFVGCLLSNLLTGAVIWDVIFGSLATLAGAVFTRLLRKKSPFLAPVPPILANALVVPLVLIYAYGVTDAWWFLVLTVGAGEVISCGVLGMVLYFALRKNAHVIFGQQNA